MSLDAKLKPYAVMKDSGLPWLGAVPEHWDIARGKRLLKTVDERSKTGEQELLTVSSARGVIPRRHAAVTMFKAESYVGYKLCWPGDLVINSLWAWAGGLGVSKYHGIVSSAYGVYRPRDPSSTLPAYIDKLVRSSSFHWELKVRSKGIWTSRLQLTDEAFLDAPFPSPPASEQAAIVRFIDYVDRRIRRYIRAKRKLIKLLEEQRQAIIHQAVTGQIDVRTGKPYPAYKPSGIEWLGDVPEHWDVHRAKTMFAQSSLPVQSSDEMVTCFRDGQVTLRRNRRMDGYTEAIMELGYQGIRQGQLVLHSMDAFAGAVGVSDSDGKCSPEYVICDPKTNGIYVPYYGLLIRSLALWGLFVMLCPSVRERAPRIRFTLFGRVVLPKPPEREQAAIATHLAVIGRETDTAIARASCEIELLNEYRSRLIADVVTGKLDVREAAASLPDEPEDPESNDGLDEMLEIEMDQVTDQDDHDQEHDDD